MKMDINDPEKIVLKKKKIKKNHVESIVLHYPLENSKSNTSRDELVCATMPVFHKRATSEPVSAFHRQIRIKTASFDTMW